VNHHGQDRDHESGFLYTGHRVILLVLAQKRKQCFAVGVEKANSLGISSAIISTHLTRARPSRRQIRQHPGQQLQSANQYAMLPPHGLVVTWM
jgi:hypothetical protein